MAINWRLKTHLSIKHAIYTVADFRKLICKKTGVIISLQNLTNMVNKRPKQIRLETMELICSALNCSLHDILEIRPKQFKKINDKKKLSFKNTPHSKRSLNVFPDPKDYL
ncbi:helix-turn-helix transcriptional regulator [Candidatus Parcubacteria bacterium]|nr:helix-turn-helix transcriptional regulator [Candidatus Parcubacteria bacterium]